MIGRFCMCRSGSPEAGAACDWSVGCVCTEVGHLKQEQHVIGQLYVYRSGSPEAGAACDWSVVCVQKWVI